MRQMMLGRANDSIVKLVFRSALVRALVQLGYTFRTDGVVILQYHRVSPSPSSPGTVASVSPGVFDWQISFMKGRGYRIVSLDEAIRCLWSKRICRHYKPVVITFDDGHRDNYEYAYPILKKHGVPATIFLVSQYIGKTMYYNEITGEWSDEDGGDCYTIFKFLDWDEAREMSGLISFGSHGSTHRNLAELNSRELWREVSDSKSIIEAEIGQSVRWFSYPFGSVNDNVRRAVRRAGYIGACSVERGINLPAVDVFALRRNEVVSAIGKRFELVLSDGARIYEDFSKMYNRLISRLDVKKI